MRLHCSGGGTFAKDAEAGQVILLEPAGGSSGLGYWVALVVEPLARCGRKVKADEITTLGRAFARHEQFLVVQFFEPEQQLDVDGGVVSSKFRLDNQRTMVLASGVISADVSSSFRAVGHGLPFCLRRDHINTKGGCSAEGVGYGCKQKRGSGPIAECSHCERAYHVRCLAPDARSAVLELDAGAVWACTNCSAESSVSANEWVFADADQHAALQHATARYLRDAEVPRCDLGSLHQGRETTEPHTTTTRRRGGVCA